MIVAGTGHRPDKLGGYNIIVNSKMHHIAMNWLQRKKPDIDYVISGMALGWDQELAKACVSLDIKFHAYIPFVGQELRWPADAIQTYELLLKAADQVVYTDVGDPVQGYTPVKMFNRNIAMVDASDLILALWNGVNAGGTFNCVSYAVKRAKPVVNLWNEWLLL